MSTDTYRKTTVVLLGVIAATLIVIAVILGLVLDWGFTHVSQQIEISTCKVLYPGDTATQYICEQGVLGKTP